MAKKEEKAATPPPPGIDFSGDAGQGFENVKHGDLSIPFLMMLQDGSPEVKKTHPQHLVKGIPGARAGHIINTLTREILNPNEGDKVPFVPCFYQKLWVEWTDRNKGGGIVMSHADDRLLAQCHKNDKGQDVLPNGNILVTTAYFFGLYITPDGVPVKMVLSLTSTQLKKARQWLSLATSIVFKRADGSPFNPPLFSHVYNLSCIGESNAKGSWMGWKIENGGVVQQIQLVENARETKKQFSENQLALKDTTSAPDDEIPGQ